MDFVAVMEQAIALLRQRGRVTYRPLQLQFTLDDAQFAALKDELLYSQPQVRDDTGRGLLWTEDAGPVPIGAAAPVAPPAQAPLTYTPPYLAEKILTSRSALEGERGAYRLRQALPTVQVPATVQAVLAARIDRLPPEEKDLLQTAAVIGHEVPLPLLQAMAARPAEGLHRSLAHLQATELLYETQLFPEPEYTFTHALTHEVAYGGLLHERRRVLHARIVEAFEALAGDRGAEQVERLAHHAVRGEVWDKALAYCRQAGDKTMAQSAYREAVGYFEQALSALPHLPERRDTCEQAVDLRLALRSALLPSGDLGRILAHLREAEALAAALDDPRRAQVITEARRVVGAGPTYITFDLDGLDPIYAIGTGTPEPGGLSMRDAQVMLRGLRGLHLIGGDVCEVSPPLDPTGHTALNGANLLFEILCVVADAVAQRRT